ncbi:hypothetical protein OC842_004775 [Tilletia horrida]|uniref:Uncharacterized protein n=1 Tax=Tilletia horrida TaxID=155126 RepID=A0AAN6GDL4_9BASI|nr:hypothetical protein OC842_004775 [Tilletia horrida]
MSQQDAPPEQQQQQQQQQLVPAGVVARPGIAHTTSYNSQLDFLLRGAALQAQDRAIVSSERRRKRSATSRRGAHVDSAQDGDGGAGGGGADAGEGADEDDFTTDESESELGDASSDDAAGDDSNHVRRRHRRRRGRGTGDDYEDDDDDDETSSVTSTDTASTAEAPELAFDPALTASTATLGPASGPLRTRIVPNLSTAPEEVGTAPAGAPFPYRAGFGDSQGDLDGSQAPDSARLRIPSGRLKRTPLRSWSGTFAPEGVADYALEEAATLYALASASSTTSHGVEPLDSTRVLCARQRSHLCIIRQSGAIFTQHAAPHGHLGPGSGHIQHA